MTAPNLWSSPDAFGRQVCLSCKGNGFRYGKLRPAETCSNCGGKGHRFAKGGER
jgi:DnaJ-class molecular chaperone